MPSRAFQLDPLPAVEERSTEIERRTARRSREGRGARGRRGFGHGRVACADRDPASGARSSSSRGRRPPGGRLLLRISAGAIRLSGLRGAVRCLHVLCLTNDVPRARSGIAALGPRGRRCNTRRWKCAVTDAFPSRDPRRLCRRLRLDVDRGAAPERLAPYVVAAPAPSAGSKGAMTAVPARCNVEYWSH